MSLSHLISIDDLTPDDISTLLNLGHDYAEKMLTPHFKTEILNGCMVINLFLENSTRTRLSFEMATKRLGGDVLNMGTDGSSLKKGESIQDTLQTLNAMRPDALVVRHGDNDTAKMATEIMDCPVLNAGTGTSEHPTQALLDALTIQRNLGQLDGITVAICGDIRHSRVAGSNAKLLTKMGAQVRFVAPKDLLPTETDLPCFTDFEDGIKNCDIIMMLRIQRERLAGDLSLSADDYFTQYGLTHSKLETCAPKAMVMHPGPMNRGVEICPDMADDPDRSLILQQVEMGVAMRMACLDMLTRFAQE